MARQHTWLVSLKDQDSGLYRDLWVKGPSRKAITLAMQSSLRPWESIALIVFGRAMDKPDDVPYWLTLTAK